MRLLRLGFLFALLPTLAYPLAGVIGTMLRSDHNLDDLMDAATARTNLGLGSLAVISPSGSPSSSNFLRGDNTWSIPAGGSGATYVLLTADRTNATTSYADITDLSWAVSANTRYDIECKLIYSANATTTGIGIGWTGPASPTLTGALMVSGITGATVGGTMIVGNDTGSVTTASVATTGNFVSYHGFWSNGANAGTLQMRFKSEVAVASAIVIKAGSYCKYTTY